MRKLLCAFAVITLNVSIFGGADAGETVRLTVSAQARSYLLERPQTAEPAPTIIMLHGLGGTSEGEARNTGLDRLGPPRGFATAFPQGRSNIWNRFPLGQETPQAIEFWKDRGGPSDDVGFLKALVADLIRRGVADPARIYIAGASNGGFMAFSMVCFDASLFAGIGILISSMTDQIGQDCRPAKPLPIVMLTGTADTTVPPGGGSLAPIAGQRTTSLSVWSTDRTIAFFRQLNRCDAQVERSVMPVQASQRIEVERSAKCAGGTVLAYRVIGGTHRSTVQALSTGQMLLDFFAEQGRPAATATAKLAPAAAPSGPAVASTGAANPGAFNFIAFNRRDGGINVAGTVRRTSGNEWVEIALRGPDRKLHSTKEDGKEIIFHDRSSDVYLWADFVAKRIYMRQGAGAWQLHSEIVRVDK